MGGKFKDVPILGLASRSQSPSHSVIFQLARRYSNPSSKPASDERTFSPAGSTTTHDPACEGRDFLNQPLIPRSCRSSDTKTSKMSDPQASEAEKNVSLWWRCDLAAYSA
jgi:hypothetical protein